MPLTLRLRNAAYWLVPPLVALAIYWPGLAAWFQQDDFGWLQLLDQVRQDRSLASALFQPQAQGSLRPLGERAYFLGLHALFGLHALPFRALAFLVQFGSMALVAVIVRRMTGSKWAGLLAAVFWIANDKLFIVMTWSSEFMLILCGFFLLLALDQFQRYAASGRRRHLAGCWAAFLVGFGALESNAVFPLLAATWALLFARKHVLKTLPMFAVSALYTLMHMLVAPKSAAGPYAIKIGWHMLRTLRTYWEWAWVPVGIGQHTPFPEPAARVAAWVFTAAVAAYVLLQARRGRREPLWFLAWFGITILPVLPLPRHISEYYLTLPVLGIAMLGADAVVQAWRSGRVLRFAAGALAIFYLVEQAPCAYANSRWWYERSVQGRNWLDHVAQARRRYPERAIVYQGIDELLYYNAVTNGALSLIQAGDVWIAPGIAARLGNFDGAIQNALDVTLAPEVAKQLFERGRLEVYDIRGLEIKRVGDPMTLAPELRAVFPAFILRLGEREDELRLAEGWHVAEKSGRWMSARSVTWISLADPAAGELFLRFRAPANLFAKGPARLSVYLVGQAAGSTALGGQEADFELAFPLPPGVARKDRVELRIECDRSFRVPPDERDLSLIFGVIGVRKAPL